MESRADGRCYPRETMVEYMRLCQKYNIHLLSDEIYGLTTFATKEVPNPTPFTSLLSIDKTGIIDPSLCHVVHGMSKVTSSRLFTKGLLCQWYPFRNVDIPSESATPRCDSHNTVLPSRPS
jgi:hypothetical protein